MLNKVLYTVFFCFVLLFLATMHVCPYPFDYLVKTIPILCLAVLAFSNIPGIKGILIGVGLLFSGCGDVLLHIDGVAYFVHGLGAFLIAHLFYIAAFISQPAITRGRLPVLLAIGVYGVVMGVLLFPHLGDMLIPVAAYLFIILAMGISAALGTANHTLVIAGAGLFILSDSLIAINRFLMPVPQSDLLIMITYYLAQLFITFGSSKQCVQKIPGG
jgi:alkenylglycerophosphocholine/alkenylglycerophosphoethanolamine hydrolase